MSKICFVTTVPFSAKHFLLLYMNVLAKNNEVFLVSNFDDIEESKKDFAGIHLMHIPISRKISIKSDIKAILSMYRLMKLNRFSIVHSCTPKAGILSMVASRLAGIPLRFHTFTGQVWATKSGAFRWLLKSIDKVIFHCASGVLIDSPSQREFLLTEGVVDEKRSRVLGQGSICGVDTNEFRPDATSRAKIRRKYLIPDDAFVFLYIGRLNSEKGIIELVDAFLRIAIEHDDARLLIVGPDEEQMIEKINARAFNITNHIICDYYTKTPEQLMAAADVFCLPSHREGFGAVIIESAAVGIPSLGSNIYGITDAIVDGETGLLHERGDIHGIYTAMKTFISNPQCAIEMGSAARGRALTLFSNEFFVSEFISYYKLALSKKSMAMSE